MNTLNSLSNNSRAKQVSRQLKSEAAIRTALQVQMLNIPTILEWHAIS